MTTILLFNTLTNTFFAVRYIYKYKICSSHDVRAGITFENIDKWVDVVFATEEDSGNINESVGTVGDRTSESDEELEEVEDV